MLEYGQILVLGVIILVSKKMRKICALFCSLGVLTSVSNRYSKSCEKCSQNLISYQRAYREGNSFVGILSRLSWGIFKMCAGIFGFLSSDSFADWVNFKEDENKKKTLKNWWKIGSVLVGADGFRDLMDVLNLSDERADFELLKEVYDKNFKGKSGIILENLKENDFIASYSAIRFLEASIEFVGYWNTYCESAKQNMLKILTLNANLSKIEDNSAVTETSIIKILDGSEDLLESEEIKKRIIDIFGILDKMSSNIRCIEKIKNDYVNNQVELNFDDVKLKFVEIQKSQQSLYEEASKNLTGLYNFLKNIEKSVDKT